jgi:hypothetical protein
VAGRFQIRGKPTPFRGSGPHSPPRWRTRGLRSESPLPFARKEPFRGPVWPAPPQRTPDPGLQPRANSRLAGLLPRSQH